LALAQTRALIEDWSRYTHEAFELVPLTTQGDKNLAPSFFKTGDKGIFTKELDQALLDGRADIAVHSLKDLPYQVPEGLSLVGVGLKEDPRDAWVSKQYPAIQDCPAGARVGTSSVRRTAQVQHYYPDLKVLPVRGNVQRRLEQLDTDHFDGLILAASGLKRLGLDSRIAQHLPLDTFTPAIGQGYLGVTAPAEKGFSFLETWQDGAVWDQVAALRVLMVHLEGGCSLPLGAIWDHGQLVVFLQDPSVRKVITRSIDIEDSYLHTAHQMIKYLQTQK